MAMSTVRLSHLGMAILPAYLVVTILIGWVSRRTLSGANDFLNASRSLPLWVVAAAFLAANSGALEIVGLSAMAAQYGVQAFHFYWIGAIPAMVFLSAFMMPIYMRSGVQSLPEYLERRFDAPVRLINSWFILVMGTALSGIGLYAMAEILHVVFGWTFTAGAFLAAGVVLIDVILGGLRATIYNEVFQLLNCSGTLAASAPPHSRVSLCITLDRGPETPLARAADSISHREPGPIWCDCRLGIRSQFQLLVH